jgi:hypothetical protein
MPTYIPANCYGCRRPIRWWQRQLKAQRDERLRRFHWHCWLTLKRWTPRVD